MIQIVLKDSTGTVRYAQALSDFPRGWTFRDLKKWLDLVKSHSAHKLTVYWKVVNGKEE